MKKFYVPPTLEVELYRLDASIASNCAVVVTMGDYGGGAGEPACYDYLEMVEKAAAVQMYSLPDNVNFWENTCDCYVTAGSPGFFTS